MKSSKDLIIDVLSILPEKIKKGKGDDRWTKEIKQSLFDLGLELGWETSCSGLKKSYSEWLYDLVWFKNESGDEDYNLLEIGLIMESEWKSDWFQIKYDFEKLLLGRSENRLMVFQGNNLNKDDIFLKLDKSIKSFKMGTANDSFILAFLNNDTFKFEFKVYPC